MLPEKLKEVLSEDDQKKLETAIGDLIESKSDERADLKVEAKTKELTATLEADFAKKLDEAIVAEKAKLEEEKTKAIEALEESLLEKLSSFLDLQISEKISEETLEKIAINETFKPIIEGIKDLFESKFIELDTDGEALLRDAKEEIESLNDKISSEITEKIELKESIDRLKADILVKEKTKDLSPEQATKVAKFFEDKDLKETEKKIDAFLEMIVEKEEAEDAAEKREALSENVVATGGDGLEEGSDALIVEKKDEKTSMSVKANSLL